MATSDKTIPRITSRALGELTRLMRLEFKLLRAEISEKLTLAGLSAAFVIAGAFLVLVAVVLLAQAAASGLVVYGFSWPVAFLLVAAVAVLAGAALLWLGINGLSAEQLTPSKTLNQLQKDAKIAQTGE